MVTRLTSRPHLRITSFISVEARDENSTGGEFRS